MVGQYLPQTNETCYSTLQCQFVACRIWLDEDAHAGAILAASMEERISTNIVIFDRTYQVWAFLLEHCEPTG